MRLRYKRKNGQKGVMEVSKVLIDKEPDGKKYSISFYAPDCDGTGIMIRGTNSYQVHHLQDEIFRTGFLDIQDWFNCIDVEVVYKMRD